MSCPSGHNSCASVAQSFILSQEIAYSIVSFAPRNSVRGAAMHDASAQKAKSITASVCRGEGDAMRQFMSLL
jgi:hypothetical protein